MRIRHVFGVLALIVGTLAASATVATADTQPGEADLGSASFIKSGTTVDIPALASCLVDGTDSASSDPVILPGVTFGGGNDSCTRAVIDPDNNTTSTSSTVKGQNFELSALTNAGGPRITIAQYQLSCTGTQGHTAADWGFSGLSGLASLPSPVPANYTQTITRADGTALATAVFNVLDQPGGGSTSITMMTITFAPASGLSGSVTVGHTECTPTP
jgi:hypothetical protein